MDTGFLKIALEYHITAYVGSGTGSGADESLCHFGLFENNNMESCDEDQVFATLATVIPWINHHINDIEYV